MEPNRATPESQFPTPESYPQFPAPESQPSQASSPELAPSAERGGEQSAAAQAAVAAQTGAISLPAPVPQPIAQPTQQQAQDDNPVVAADEDLIEKEWVDKAKSIISQTAGDPARREKEVSKLQADYLKKRYGKELGASADD